MTPLLVTALLGGCGTDCPPGSTMGGDGLCYLDDEDTTPAPDDTGTPQTEPAPEWQALPEGCTAPDTLPADPLTLDSALFVQDYVFAEMTEVEVDGDIVYTGGNGGGGGGVMSFDMSSGAPEYLSSVTPDIFINRTYHIELGEDGVVYSTHRDHGLSVGLFADPSRPEQSHYVELEDLAGMARTDTHLWVSTYTGELLTFDITDPTDPVEIDRIGGLGSAWEPHRLGDRLYVADNTLGLGVVDISDPDSPALLGYIEAAGGVQDLAFSADGSTLYAAVGGAGVEVFDLTDPDEPVSVGLVDVHYSVISVATDGDLLWAVDQQDLVAFDISTPADPFILNTEQTEQWAMAVAAADGRAYVADWGYLAVYALDTEQAAPDLELDAKRLYLPAGEDAVTLSMSNLGAGALTLSGATISGADLTVEVDTTTIAANESASIRIQPPAEAFESAEICLASNDPDEPTRIIEVIGTGSDATGVGGQAPDFTLPGIDGLTYTLSDQRGKPVVLVYFATW